MNDVIRDERRIGVYICHCGTNISHTVDVEAVVEHARKLPGVVVVRAYKYMCSDPGQEIIKNDIKEQRLTRVVVASCSPLMHEETFRRACEEAGLNSFLFQMANIREHCSWVHSDGREATEKAKRLVAGAVRRVWHHVPLEERQVPVRPEALVVGAGIAGIEAALRIADSGKKVYLVEKEPSIGGHMAQFDKTFPTLDCAACILTPKMVNVGQHPNIKLLSYSEVEHVSGYVGNFKVRVRRKARYIDEEKCVGCMQCIDQCVFTKPKFPNEHDQGLGLRKPVYVPFPQAVPQVPVIDPETCLQLTKGKCKQKCVEACAERNAVDLDQQDQIVEVDVGTIIVATGFDLFDAGKIARYGYGRLNDVVNSLEFERLSHASGPTSGEIITSKGKTPEAVAIIHCVGSRDENYHEYCSRVCCMYSLKFAHLVKEKTGAEVYSFYIDMRTPGKGYEEFYKRLLNEGVHFIRGKCAEVTDVAETPEERGKLVVVAEDTLLGLTRRVPVDLVILSSALEPRGDVDEVARTFSLSCAQGDFFLEKHPKLAPVEAATDGIYLAGACQGPKDIPDSVAQGAAAAACALSLMDGGVVTLEPISSEIDADRCSGCKTCLTACPFSAIVFDEKEKVSVVVEELCKGCGTCVASCPSGAASQKGFADVQIYSEMEGILA